MERVFSGTAAVLGLWSVVVVGPARAAEPALREFAIPSGADASQITRGPDGNVWVTEPGADKVARIGPGGVVTEFSLPVPGSSPCGITTGPDGNLWFTEAGRPVVGRITPGGVISEFAGPSPGRGPLPLGCDIVTGADGHLWITHLRQQAPGHVDRVSTTGDVETYPSFGTAFAGLPEHITAGGDGALWVVEAYAARLGRITTAGAITEVALPAGDYHDVAAGPDGNLWLAGPSRRDPTDGS